MITSPILTTTDLNVSYNGLHALKGISCAIAANQITALIGASGSGKSTFLRSLDRMLDTVRHAHVSGVIRFKDANILDPTADVIALRQAIGMVFQNPTPFPKSIYDNVAYGLEIQGLRNTRTSGAFSFQRRRINGADVASSSQPLDQAVYESLTDAALWDEVKDRLHESAYSLSGGQQQRLCIARAIAVRPEVLLLDEPCSDLDPISTNKIEQLLIKLKERYTIVIVTHNLPQARRIADAVGFFHLGKLVEFGPTKQLFDRAKEKVTREYVRGDFG